MQKYHDEPKQYKGYLKSALVRERIRRCTSATGARFVTDASSYSNEENSHSIP